MVSPAVQCVASLSLVGPVTGCDKGRFQGFISWVALNQKQVKGCTGNRYTGHDFVMCLIGLLNKNRFKYKFLLENVLQVGGEMKKKKELMILMTYILLGCSLSVTQ